ncbi:peptidoglycan DD-metalloendopeptidase family protein [Paenibacillus athensensis]|uniref:M23ase beta-sheet core domain-containing protein n=1 Tax=Paenibacillus athensensis TaxID=1967502 RepID=A0A4Y8Q935_9BACL|nr:M23 family metallopeptidase [Paenibacillus athensensis]MCD1260107.1 peptidoglycan DD-metalloendopeptidase family protein [Paenibacillus athensensis]
MDARSRSRSNRGPLSRLRSGRYWLGVSVASFAAAAIITVGCGLWLQRTDAPAAGPPTASAQPSAQPKAAGPPSLLDFHMQDLDRGWARYSDGVRVTVDGGAHWSAGEAASESVDGAGGANAGEAGSESAGGAGSESVGEASSPSADELARTAALGFGPPAPGTAPAAIDREGRSYAVRQFQGLTDRVAWARSVPSGAPDSAAVLLVTTDGGHHWLDPASPEAAGGLALERERQRGIVREAALYASPEAARRAMQSAWTLLPDTASPGDAVLVRSSAAGEVAWQGKTYKLQPFGAGFYVYLPMSMQAKPGTYTIGGAKLTVKAKTFDTQRIQVTEQMESMRQETERIQADQRKIDAARSRSEPVFLFTGPFMQPIEGILTTPFGFTRYVNGKYDSTHQAIDLAADEGTPVKATNDGVVALAESLYLTGNSVYIDHGMSLFSQYIHMSKLLVKAGDKVKRGDVIGLVGTTGFSTGPHLHFTFWAHNVPVNPNLFFNTQPLQWSAPDAQEASR